MSNIQLSQYRKSFFQYREVNQLHTHVIFMCSFIHLRSPISILICEIFNQQVSEALYGYKILISDVILTNLRDYPEFFWIPSILLKFNLNYYNFVLPQVFITGIQITNSSFKGQRQHSLSKIDPRFMRSDVTGQERELPWQNSRRT